MFAGLPNWNNNVALRAFHSDVFKLQNPRSWQMVKHDYLIYEDDDLDEDFHLGVNLPDAPALDPGWFINDENSAATNNNTGIGSGPTNNDTGIGSGSAGINANHLTLIKESVQKGITEAMKFLTRVKDCFKCPLCLEIKVDRISFCNKCDTFIGCYPCVAKVRRCPSCRNAFESTIHGYLVPGLRDALDLPMDCPLQAVEDREPHSSDDLDETLPLPEASTVQAST